MQTTQREATRRNDICIRVGYCDLWHTLKECADGKDAYTAGVYGWNADIYEFDTFAIVTGYRPFGKDILSYEFCKKWEKKAQAHYNKVNSPLPNGKFRSCAVRGRMRYTFRTHFTIKTPEEDAESLVRHRNRAGVDTDSEKMVYYEQEKSVPEIAKALCEEKTAQNATGHDTRLRPKGTLAAGLGQRPNRRGESLRQASASSARKQLTKAVHEEIAKWREAQGGKRKAA